MGGEDEGATPLEVFLGSLAGCENAMANIISKEMSFDLQKIDFDIKAEMDPDGMMRNKNVRPYFQKVFVDARVKTSETQERVDELQKEVDSRCPVFTTMEAADVEMVVNWTKA
ncbi:MAG: OsmC family protein [Alkalibacterium sp.]|uniref:OsmC family protein n=1 Tax=Alkalibacterium sp. TaxID=1872447 RepID=UPI00264715F8|nr:OsmC family protein [Alkalibacterium sp.]MDN6293770.1 OsmC family protein [Alkalibacterium sp.]MDN6295646.1 OsmC family protein [Alkalibacterium sp.]MDN6409471.1 OsmC family protein [Tetragenococcus halophilus]